MTKRIDPIVEEPSMHGKPMLALVGIMAVVAPPLAAQQFEGIIQQREISLEKYALEDRGFDVSEAIFDVPIDRILALREELEADGAMTLIETKTYIKGNLIRTDMETDEGPAYVIMDLGQGVIRMFQPTEKMYIEWTKEEIQQMQEMVPDVGGAAEESEPRETGLSRSINGMTCVAYDIETDEGTTRAWVSKENRELVDAFAELTEAVTAMAMEEGETDESLLVAKYGFPVLIQRLGYDMYEIEQTVSVDRRSVSEDLFATPADYTKMTMADMMRRYR